MADRALLNQELEQVRDKRTELRRKNPGATMPEDARAEDQRYADRMTTLVAQIETEEQRIRDAMFEETNGYIDQMAPERIVVSPGPCRDRRDATYCSIVSCFHAPASW